MRLPFARQDSSPLPRSIKEVEQEKSVNDIVRTFYEQIQMKQSSFLLNMSVVDQSLKQLLDKEHAKIQKWRDEAKGFNNSKVKFSNSNGHLGDTAHLRKEAGLAKRQGATRCWASLTTYSRLGGRRSRFRLPL